MQRLLVEVLGGIRRTVVFVTHDVDEALLLGDRVVVLGRTAWSPSTASSIRATAPAPDAAATSRCADQSLAPIPRRPRTR